MTNIDPSVICNNCGNIYYLKWGYCLNCGYPLYDNRNRLNEEYQKPITEPQPTYMNINNEPLSTKQLHELNTSQAMTIDRLLGEVNRYKQAFVDLGECLQKGNYIKAGGIIREMVMSEPKPTWTIGTNEFDAEFLCETRKAISKGDPLVISKSLVLRMIDEIEASRDKTYITALNLRIDALCGEVGRLRTLIRDVYKAIEYRGNVKEALKMLEEEILE